MVMVAGVSPYWTRRSLFLKFQRTLGYWDWPAVHILHWTHRRRHVPLTFPWYAHICLRSLRRFSKGEIYSSRAQIKTKPIFIQLWDIREGMCKQTFPGHESDINAVTVSILKRVTPATASLPESCFSVLSKWFCICNWFWWCNLSVVRHPSWSGTSHVFTR